MDLLQLLFFCVADFFTTSVMIYFYTKVNRLNFKFSIKNILYIIAEILFISINNIYTTVSMKLLVSLIISIILIKVIFKKEIKDVIYNVIIFYIIGLIVEIILSNILLYKINDLNILNNSLLMKLIFTIINSLVLILIFSNNYIINFINKIKNSFNKLLNFYTFSISILFILNIVSIFKLIKTNNNFLIVLISLTCIVFMIISLIEIINDRYNIKALNENNNNLKNSVKAYSETIEDCKEFKHNIKNEIYGIKSILPLEQQEKINNIIKKYIFNYEWIDKIDEIPEGLQGLIYLKKKEAELKNIKININSNKIDTNENDYMDLCNIIGILIDNSIEAIDKVKEKILEINIKEYENKLEINMINRFNNNINLNEIGKKNYSTKRYKSGIGLNYIKKINNPKVRVNFKIVNDLFITKIIYINKKTVNDIS